MKKLRYYLLISLVMAMIVSCSKQDLQQLQEEAPDDVNLKSAVFVPFKGEFKVYVDQVIHMPPPPPKVQLVLGVGKVTHLGKTDISILQNWWPPAYPGAPGTGTGEITFTAANGDVLLAQYNDGDAYLCSPTYVEITFPGYFKDGGTGRFEYATGYFTWEGIYNPTANEGLSIVDGEILYGNTPL